MSWTCLGLFQFQHQCNPWSLISLPKPLYISVHVVLYIERTDSTGGIKSSTTPPLRLFLVSPQHQKHQKHRDTATKFCSPFSIFHRLHLPLRLRSPNRVTVPYNIARGNENCSLIEVCRIINTPLA